MNETHCKDVCVTKPERWKTITVKGVRLTVCKECGRYIGRAHDEEPKRGRIGKP